MAARGRGRGRGGGGSAPTAQPPNLFTPTPQTQAASAQHQPTPQALQSTHPASAQIPIEYFASITAFRPHHDVSFEELRLKDYAAGRGPKSVASNESSYPRGFNTSADGFAVAAVPSVPGGWRHSSCRLLAELSPNLGRETVVLRVGSDGASQDFTIHRNIIIRRSAFVRDALKGAWKEAASGIISLPEDDPKVVGLYQDWLYTGCIYSEPASTSVPQQRVKEYDSLVKCYILGEKLLDSTFKDAIADSIVALLLKSHLFDPSLTSLVYENTPPKSPLRKLWQDVYMFCGAASWLDEEHDPHPDFTVDLSRRQMNRTQAIRPQDAINALLDPCSYHEHEDARCYRNSSVSVLEDGARSVLLAMLR